MKKAMTKEEVSDRLYAIVKELGNLGYDPEHQDKVSALKEEREALQDRFSRLLYHEVSLEVQIAASLPGGE